MYNACQFLSQLRAIIPGAQDWPDFKPNRSKQFEARVSMAEVVDNKITHSSVFLRHMAGSKLPVAVAHGEGRAPFGSEDLRRSADLRGLPAVRYVDGDGVPRGVPTQSEWQSQGHHWCADARWPGPRTDAASGGGDDSTTQ
ncbi:hypothetical protein FIBSPDRAFT_854873 [Athelia psychrophila]|uniref:Uncharacterized protein n=1 Tax=Athelia psychrophila TaxID=1759441 RepID=A0A166PXL8_9AGAM|nr:hypothetical protein FIBSPDRAFT_854873 [Fibularhizoctonia sp. CBS 109695]